MNLRVYIAAPYPTRADVKNIALDLRRTGIAITSRWIFEDDALDDKAARRDLTDVARCDVLIAYNPSGWENTGTGGRHVELGYAIALMKPIILVGARSNVFHQLSDITFTEKDDLIDTIRFVAEDRGLL